MLGHRGCRLAVTYPEIYEMQVRAIMKAAIDVARAEYGQWLAGERPASNGPVEAGEDGVHLSREQFQQLLAHRAAQPEPDAPQPVRRRRGPVPAAIARQRAQFAADGRRMLARQGRL